MRKRTRPSTPVPSPSPADVARLRTDLRLARTRGDAAAQVLARMALRGSAREVVEALLAQIQCRELGGVLTYTWDNIATAANEVTRG